MNAHTLSTDALSTLGTIIDDSAKRDAIHLAVAPMVARVSMQPGEHVDAAGNVCRSGMGVGVVDPFLREAVATGERFWCVLYPRTITSLRHEWEHPAFGQERQTALPAGVSAAERWLREFADTVGADYDEMIDVAKSHCAPKKLDARGYRDNWPDYLSDGGRWEGQDTPAEFWTHFTAVTGLAPDSEYGPPGIFSCSC